MTKFKIGDQWMTRGGWLAVVVNETEDCLIVYHQVENESHTVRRHTYLGKCTVDKCKDFNLKRRMNRND